MSPKARTDLRKGSSEAKFDVEEAGELRLAAAPQNPSQICEKLKFPSDCFRHFFGGGRRKMKRRGSPETRFGKVWGRSELISGGKRAFEVSSSGRSYYLRGLFYPRIKTLQKPCNLRSRQ